MSAPAPAPAPAPFTLSRATAADVPELIALQYASFPPVIRELFMGCESEADMPRVVEETRATMANDPLDIWVKVTDNSAQSRGKIVAASNWKVHLNPSPASGPDPSDDTPPSWLTGEKAQKSKAFLDEMNEKRRQANAGTGYVHLHICFTDQAYRRRGAGNLMMKWGCDLADQLFLPGWVEASPVGSELYRVFGFYEYEKLTGILGGGLNMKRDAKLGGIEGGKA